jgi:ankyrin repeat protein
LVKAGADTAIKDRQGATALDHARTRGYQDMIKILEAARSRKT